MCAYSSTDTNGQKWTEKAKKNVFVMCHMSQTLPLLTPIVFSSIVPKNKHKQLNFKIITIIKKKTKTKKTKIL